MSCIAGLFLFGCQQMQLETGIEENALVNPDAQTMPALSMITLVADADVIDFEAYAAGSILSQVMSQNGAGPVQVWADNPNFPGQNAAMVFNSAAPTGGDPDLGTPNEDFGGPGIGVGGEAGSTYENNVALGKVLIITENFNAANPDDAAVSGATYSFDFSALEHITIYSMHILDVEAEESTATVDFYDAADALIATFELPHVGNNGLFNFLFGADGVAEVARMVVHLNGSGAIDNIVFKSVPPPPPPGEGCTGTPGYWRNHTMYSASGNRDETWDEIGASGENSTFFLSGQTYLQVLNTSAGGNAYYILAFQYIAAKLNVLKGTSYPAEVGTAIDAAETLFDTYTPAQIAALKGSDALRKQFIDLGTILDNYNNGIIGPGHCE